MEFPWKDYRSLRGNWFHQSVDFEMPNLLTIDQSTSATKALVFDIEGHLLAKTSFEHRQIYPEPGWVEHDAEQIWQNTLEVVSQLIKQYPDHSRDLGWLSITNQRETLVVFDRKTGEPLHNAIVWQCRRGDAICEELKNQGCEPEVREKTGLKIDTYFSGSKFKWLVENMPSVAERLREGSALVGTMDAYLIYRLTRGKVFATDPTNASRTLLYDIRHRRWDESLCEMFGVPVQALPEVRDSNAEFGQTDFHGLLPAELPICGVLGDSQASLFALRCFTPGDAKVTIGSGSSVLLNIGDDMKLTDSGAVTTIAWVLDGEAAYSFEGIINYSAATIDWLRNQLQLITGVIEVEGLATSLADNGGVYLVPAFAGLSAPYWNPEARAAIVGMSAHSTKAHVVRAALESIAYQIRDVLEMMKADAGVEPKRINADGGATANRFLMQFAADIVRIQLCVAQVAESSPLGAAWCGALGQKAYRSLDEIASLPNDFVTYQPEMDSSKAENYYNGWQQAVRRVL